VNIWAPVGMLTEEADLVSVMEISVPYGRVGIGIRVIVHTVSGCLGLRRSYICMYVHSYLYSLSETFSDTPSTPSAKICNHAVV